MIDFFLSTRAAPQTLATRRLSSSQNNSITPARPTASRFYFRRYLENLYRSIVSQWFAPAYVFIIAFLSRLIIFIDCKLFGGMGNWVLSVHFIYGCQVSGCSRSDGGINIKGREG